MAHTFNFSYHLINFSYICVVLYSEVQYINYEYAIDNKLENVYVHAFNDNDVCVGYALYSTIGIMHIVRNSSNKLV